MLTFAILIWLGRGENPIDSSVLKKVLFNAAFCSYLTYILKKQISRFISLMCCNTAQKAKI
jgi:hypothetical protein